MFPFVLSNRNVLDAVVDLFEPNFIYVRLITDLFVIDVLDFRFDLWFPFLYEKLLYKKKRSIIRLRAIYFPMPNQSWLSFVYPVFNIDLSVNYEGLAHVWGIYVLTLSQSSPPPPIRKDGWIQREQYMLHFCSIPIKRIRRVFQMMNNAYLTGCYVKVLYSNNMTQQNLLCSSPVVVLPCWHSSTSKTYHGYPSISSAKWLATSRTPHKFPNVIYIHTHLCIHMER